VDRGEISQTHLLHRAAAESPARPILNEKEQTTDAPDHQVATYEFEKFTCIWEHRKFGGNATEKHSIGAYFYGTNGILHIGWRDGWTFYPSNYREAQVHEKSELQEPDGHNLTLLWADFMDAIEQKRPAVARIDIAHRSSVLPLLGMVSWRAGRSIEWDGDKEQIINDPKANDSCNAHTALLGNTLRFSGLISRPKYSSDIHVHSCGP
jgi:hypothetical protein